MDDLSEKLADILNDPESMNKVRQMAESILGSEDEPPKPEEKGEEGLTSLLSGKELSVITSLISRMKADSRDPRVQLILALRPHLSEKRRERADAAIRLLKLIDLLPLIKESGLLNL